MHGLFVAAKKAFQFDKLVLVTLALTRGPFHGLKRVQVQDTGRDVQQNILGEEQRPMPTGCIRQSRMVQGRRTFQSHHADEREEDELESRSKYSITTPLWKYLDSEPVCGNIFNDPQLLSQSPK